MTSKATISLEAAASIQRRARTGYRGVVVVADMTIQLFILEVVEDGGVELRGVAPLPDDLEIGVFEFPDLDLDGKRGVEAAAAVLEAIAAQARPTLH